MEADAFRYDGRSVLVIGAATGMGAAAAQAATALGATVTALDVAKIEYAVQEAIEVDLRDRASVDGAADRIGGPIDAVFSCAGVADGTPGLMLVNFIAQRHLLERLRSDGKLAIFSSPDRPDRPVALKRRELPELLAEELRWSDEDDIFAATAKRLLKMEPT